MGGGRHVGLSAGRLDVVSRARIPADFAGDLFPHAAAVFWLVLIVENVVAQVVTGPVVGPHARWDDFQFNLFYLVLFALTGALTYHFQFVSSQDDRDTTE